MTLREALGSDAAARVHEQFDQILDNEDGIIVLIGPRHAASYCHGFGLSGCQLEMLSFQIERALRDRQLCQGGVLWLRTKSSSYF